MSAPEISCMSAHSRGQRAVFTHLLLCFGAACGAAAIRYESFQQQRILLHPTRHHIAQKYMLSMVLLLLLLFVMIAGGDLTRVSWVGAFWEVRECNGDRRR